MYDELIHDLFPHRDGHGRPSYRPHQFETIREVLSVLEDPDVNDIVVEAPTGAGKTSIAVTVARVLTRDFPRIRARARQCQDTAEAMIMMADHQVHMITSMKMLQDAYLGDDPSIRLVKGKSNYDCHRDSKQTSMLKGHKQRLSCDDAEQMFGRRCSKNCPYTQAREAAQWAAIALHNFDSFLYQASLGQAFVPRRLLTVDESHNCEEKVRSFMTMNFGPHLFRALELGWHPPAENMLDDMDAVTSWARRCLDEIKDRSDDLSKDLEAYRNLSQNATPKIDDVLTMSKIVKTLRKLGDLQQRLERFSRSVDPECLNKPALWVAYMNNGGELVLEPVDAGRFVPHNLFRYGNQRLHLSATFLNGGGAYSNSVNVGRERMHHITVPSTFEAKKRSITPVACGDLRTKLWDKNLPKVIKAIREIMFKNRGVRGVIHCTSYNMSVDLGRELKDERILEYDRHARGYVVGDFVSGHTDEDAVLMAVALNEGYDFKDELCRFQIIVRVPMLPPTKCVIARGKIKGGRYYGWRVALSIVQAYGRGMRSADDWCHTYILDSRFTEFVEKEKDQLPDWFLEAIL